MQAIEKFNNRLNNTNSNRFELWKDYRGKVDQEIKKYLPCSTQGDLLILGAGNCDDINLVTYISFFKSIVISDIDISSVNYGIKKQKIDSSKLELIQAEFSGFERSSFFDQFISTIHNCKTTSEIKKSIDKLLIPTQKHLFLGDYINRFSVILVSPIYTQLVFQQILQMVSVLRIQKYPEELSNFIEKYMLDQMPNIIDNFNQNILKLLVNNGKVIVLSDIFESNTDSVFFQDIQTNIENLAKVDTLYNNYVIKYGHGLGDYGIISLNKYLDMLDYKWFIWPFTEKRHMIVKLAVFSN
ncbi:MAG: hypothetical protein PHC62_08365 [Candidatus Izemoplasmatales bacterium]|nr:hypothetical protein [Candidatus Izemoplasmatales bacterium]